MRKYFFLDNWTLKLLAGKNFRHKLLEFILNKGYTILLSSLSLVELYNPGWASAKGNDRTKNAARFYSDLPCVIVDPQTVWDQEIRNRLEALDTLPIQLNLEQVNKNSRQEALLRFLRRDTLFIQQGLDIQKWSYEYKAVKAGWLSNVNRIIDKACIDGNLCRNKKGKLINLSSFKELFLFSLDLRHCEPEYINEILNHQVQQRSGGAPVRLSAVRLSSILFWYSYVDVDPANRMKRSGSDIGDMYHLSLIPYCSAFTADKTMFRMLKRIREPAVPLDCRVFTKPFLEKAIGV